MFMSKLMVKTISESGNVLPESPSLHGCDYKIGMSIYVMCIQHTVISLSLPTNINRNIKVQKKTSCSWNQGYLKLEGTHN